jgi:phospholipase/carboxylesterase
MREHSCDIAGWRTILVEGETTTSTIVLLHGFAMAPELLAPFGHSLGTGSRFHFPQAPYRAGGGDGYSWWPIARERGESDRNARDLAEFDPPGRNDVHARLIAYLEEIQRRSPERPLILGGFSQGGMLACDFALHEPGVLDALILMSASRIRLPAWKGRAQSLRGMPVFLSHGRSDADLAFAAGERLRDFLVDCGADVTWVPFDTGHEIPIVVWRALRRFVRGLTLASGSHPAEPLRPMPRCNSRQFDAD